MPGASVLVRSSEVGGVNDVTGITLGGAGHGFNLQGGANGIWIHPSAGNNHTVRDMDVSARNGTR